MIVDLTGVLHSCRAIRLEHEDTAKVLAQKSDDSAQVPRGVALPEEYIKPGGETLMTNAVKIKETVDVSFNFAQRNGYGKMLLQAPNNMGETPLSLAVAMGNSNAVHLILHLATRVEDDGFRAKLLQASGGEILLQEAVKRGHQQVVYDILKAAAEEGLRAEYLKASGGEILLQEAVERGHHQVVYHILRAAAEEGCRAEYLKASGGEILLQEAVKRGHQQVVYDILKAAAEEGLRAEYLKAPDGKGTMLLRSAVKSGKSNVVYDLLRATSEEGLRAGILKAEGAKLLDAAAEQGNANIVYDILRASKEDGCDLEKAGEEALTKAREIWSKAHPENSTSSS
eukprot:TRINITY_DN1467_c0_g1_i3.p1 TRINITY_DN1467_c0_g1~~TRINITY_DN1467_c0_g1_i3.p1  ORF type:complete len:379 (-),score=65.37 TRINITY_DN1467_c0_g1_i3:105-1127(-)